jgi:hypothetical protein
VTSYPRLAVLYHLVIEARGWRLGQIGKDSDLNAAIERRQSGVVCDVSPWSPRPRYLSRRRLGEGGSEAALHSRPFGISPTHPF